jgi:hypothetical protein
MTYSRRQGVLLYVDSHALFIFGHSSLSISVNRDRRQPTFVSLYSPLPSPFLSYTMPNPPGNWQRASQLDSLITRATTAAQPENNYALHIEIAEYINKKKANTYIPFS